MDLKQKRTILCLSLVCLIYFVALIFPNATGAKDESMLRVFSNDETITYPYVVHMLVTPKDIHEASWRLLIYGDYHYGYPFYFLSMLAVLPVKLLYGDAFTEHMQLNLLLLRQWISVLPMILAALVMVYLQTRFRSLWRSVGLLVLLLLVPGILRNNISWWHPDALAILAAVLTLFFLERDRLRLSRNFYAAAVFCGLSISIKLLGFFFVFALAGYVLLAWILKQERLGRTILKAGGFVVVMALVILLTNPFLFYPSQREKLVRIQTQKSVELANGYSHDNPQNYQKGPQWWKFTLEKWYGPVPFLLFLLGSLAAGCFWGEAKTANRLILAWVVPYSLYLLYFVAVKPDHYWLPAMVPLFSGSMNLVAGFKRSWVLSALSAGVLILLLWQAAVYAQSDAALYLSYLYREVAAGYSLVIH